MQSIIIAVIAVAVLGGGFLLLSSSAPTEMDTTMAKQENRTPNPSTSQQNKSMNNQTTIVDITVATPAVSTLVTAVTAAQLAETLQGPGPFTVFAPVNEAFASLPAGTVASLLLPENIAALQGVLTYHVVPGNVMASDLSDGMVVKTVNGESITINVSADGGVKINDSATVTTADIKASNGVIHLIDAVLLPPTQ